MKVKITDLSTQFPEINFTALAKRMEMNPSQLRQYLSGSKIPSEKKMKEIQLGFNQLGKLLRKSKLRP